MSQADWFAIQATIFSQERLIKSLKKELSCKETRRHEATYSLFRFLYQRDEVFYICKGCDTWFLENRPEKGHPGIDCYGCVSKNNKDRWAIHSYCEKCYDNEFCHYHEVCKKHFQTCCKEYCPAGHNQ